MLEQGRRVRAVVDGLSRKDAVGGGFSAFSGMTSGRLIGLETRANDWLSGRLIGLETRANDWPSGRLMDLGKHANDWPSGRFIGLETRANDWPSGRLIGRRETRKRLAIGPAHWASGNTQTTGHRAGSLAGPYRTSLVDKKADPLVRYEVSFKAWRLVNP